MKLGSKALFVLLCFAGGAAASTQNATSAKVQRFANPALCYLETATSDSDALLVRAELQRREVGCTSELRAEGQQDVDRALRLTRLQTVSASLQRARINRENSDRWDYQRAANCKSQQRYC